MAYIIPIPGVPPNDIKVVCNPRKELITVTAIIGADQNGRLVATFPRKNGTLQKYQDTTHLSTNRKLGTIEYEIKQNQGFELIFINQIDFSCILLNLDNKQQMHHGEG